MKNKVKMTPEKLMAFFQKFSKETGWYFNGALINFDADEVAFLGFSSADLQAKIISNMIVGNAEKCNVDLDTFIDQILAEVAKGRKK